MQKSKLFNILALSAMIMVVIAGLIAASLGIKMIVDAASIPLELPLDIELSSEATLQNRQLNINFKNTDQNDYPMTLTVSAISNSDGTLKIAESSMIYPGEEINSLPILENISVDPGTHAAQVTIQMHTPDGKYNLDKEITIEALG